ncbi:MAG: alanine racemase [Pseudomonadota bacterium]
MNSNYRYTRAEIDLPALVVNFLKIKSYAPASKIMAVIKADAYGHGMLNIAQYLSAAQVAVDAFAVACVDEAVELRKKSIDKAIVVLEGFSSKQELRAIFSYQLIPVINSLYQLELLTEEFTRMAESNSSLPLWLKFDTGMSRLGFQSEQLEQLKQQLHNLSSKINIIGLMSHFACADDPQHIHINELQLSKFKQLINSFDFSDLNYSIANSAAIINFPDSHFNWVRPGIMLYGINPLLEQTGEDIDLAVVMTLKSKLIAINNLKKGDCIGYGRDWCCPENMPVGVVAIGYGDGYPRHAKSGTPVLLNGIKTQLIGRVSMDMISIDLRPFMNNNMVVNIGDSVVLWGKGLAVEEVANCSATIAYELLCGISKRVKYVYKK